MAPRFRAGIVPVVVILLGVGLGGCLQGFLTGGLSEPVPAPDFTARTVSGENITLSRFEGQVVLLDFMGTWCGPCQRGVPGLRDLQSAYPDLVVLSVSSTDSEAQLHDFQVRYGADWPHIADDGTIVRAYLEAGSSARQMMWPSYAIVDEAGMLQWYNRGETLPATFVTALDRVGGTQGPGPDPGVLPVAGAAFVLGGLAAFSPFLVHRRGVRPGTGPHDETVQAGGDRQPEDDAAAGQDRVHDTEAGTAPGESEPDREDGNLPLATVDPVRTALVAAILYLALGAVMVWFSRPLSGRIVNLAPFVAGAAVVAIIYWRSKGTDAVQATGKRLDRGGPWGRAWAWNGHLLYYALPAWFAVVYAGMLRVSLVEVWLLHAAYGFGVAAGSLVPWGRTTHGGDMPAAHGPVRPAWLGVAALVAGALWSGLLYLR